MKIILFTIIMFFSVNANANAEEFKHFEYIDVIGVVYKKSNLDTCKEKTIPMVREATCGSITGIMNVSPKLMVRVPVEEQLRLGFVGNQRSAAADSGRAQVFWKEGFSPQDVKGLENIKDKKIRLINVSVPKNGMRVGMTSFESIIISTRIYYINIKACSSITEKIETAGKSENLSVDNVSDMQLALAAVRMQKRGLQNS